jgi:hypothetical protein
LPVWIAQWKEQHDDPSSRILRPRQVYIGRQKTDYVPLDQRRLFGSVTARAAGGEERVGMMQRWLRLCRMRVWGFFQQGRVF